MKKSLLTTVLLSGALTFSVATTTYAGCGISGGSVRVIANDFPALHAVVSGAEECAGGGVSFTKNHTQENRELQVPALKPNPAEYTVAIVANSTLVALLNEDLVQPIDQYVSRYGGNIAANQLIRIDGKIYAVAFMANAQHLFYRDDILKKAGVNSYPKTYEELLDAAEKIKQADLVKYPIVGTYKAGWNLAEEFVNMYMGYEGSFFAPGSALPNVNNAKGEAALKLMKKLTEYMNPDYLTFDSNLVQAEWEAGNSALANFWGSRANAVLDDEGGSEMVRNNTKFASAPTVNNGSTPATTLWWDGFTIAKNISDEDAEASFRAMANGVRADVANNNPDAASWIIKGSKPGKASVGVNASVQAGGNPYPMLPYMGLLHTALGNELPDYFQGNESASKTLADVETAYIAAAKEKGYL